MLRFSLPPSASLLNQKRNFGVSRYPMENMQRFRGQLEEVVDELFPSSPSKMRWVTLRDIRPCLCGAFIGAKWSNCVRPLPSGVGRMNVGQRWGTFLCQQIPEKTCLQTPARGPMRGELNRAKLLRDAKEAVAQSHRDGASEFENDTIHWLAMPPKKIK